MLFLRAGLFNWQPIGGIQLTRDQHVAHGPLQAPFSLLCNMGEPEKGPCTSHAACTAGVEHRGAAPTAYHPRGLEPHADCIQAPIAVKLDSPSLEHGSFKIQMAICNLYQKHRYWHARHALFLLVLDSPCERHDIKDANDIHKQSLRTPLHAFSAHRLQLLTMLPCASCNPCDCIYNTGIRCHRLCTLQSTDCPPQVFREYRAISVCYCK